MPLFGSSSITTAPWGGSTPIPQLSHMTGPYSQRGQSRPWTTWAMLWIQRSLFWSTLQHHYFDMKYRLTSILQTTGEGFMVKHTTWVLVLASMKLQLIVLLQPPQHIVNSIPSDAERSIEPLCYVALYAVPGDLRLRLRLQGVPSSTLTRSTRGGCPFKALDPKTVGNDGSRAKDTGVETSN